MPRPLRLDLPGIPQHVIQRGNDRQPCFFEEADYLRYRTDLRELALREGCAVHAYVLMTNHVHLLMTPSTQGAISRVMQALGRRYVRYVNDRRHRTGTLWEGRYKSCPVDDGDYLLHCHRYIELNPLRAAMVADPGDYRWSSYRHNAQGVADPLLTPHPAYLGLACTRGERLHTYCQLVMETVDAEQVESIRRHVQRQHAYGTDRFRVAIEAMLGRTAGPQKIGRPRKPAPTNRESPL